MYSLRIEHAIKAFDTWRAAFERDPIGRQQAGVRRYRVSRPTDDPHYVLIDLDFDHPEQARRFLEALQSTVWRRPELSPGLARDDHAAGTPPRSRIVETVEERTYD